MTFTDIPTLVAYINSTITANGAADITGPELHDILIGITSLISPVLQASLTAQLGAGNVGGVGTGYNKIAGTTLEQVLRDILIQAIPPIYVAPTEVLGTSIATLDNEIGTVISPVLTSTFTQHDGGAASTLAVQRNSSTIASGSPYTDATFTLNGAAAAVYQSIQTYLQGPIKNNNLGNPDATGRINAGNAISNSITYNGYRKAFFGVSTVVADSASARSLAGGILNPQVGSQLTINIPIGATSVVFAYPSTLEDPASVKYVELSNAEVKGNFTKTTVSVAGASGFTSINYSVFTYTPVAAFPTAATYVVTI